MTNMPNIVFPIILNIDKVLITEYQKVHGYTAKTITCWDTDGTAIILGFVGMFAAAFASSEVEYSQPQKVVIGVVLIGVTACSVIGIGGCWIKAFGIVYLPLKWSAVGFIGVIEILCFWAFLGALGYISKDLR